jgi:hypothetical protein
MRETLGKLQACWPSQQANRRGRAHSLREIPARQQAELRRGVLQQPLARCGEDYGKWLKNWPPQGKYNDLHEGACFGVREQHRGYLRLAPWYPFWPCWTELLLLGLLAAQDVVRAHVVAVYTPATTSLAAW